MDECTALFDSLEDDGCQCGDCYEYRELRRAELFVNEASRLIDQLAELCKHYPPLWEAAGGGGAILSELMRDHLERRNIGYDRWRPQQPRKEVYRLADRDGWDCAYCGVTLEGCPDRPMPHVDHVIPKSRGGSNSLDNKVLACAPCNMSKGARTPDEWRAALAAKEAQT